MESVSKKAVNVGLQALFGSVLSVVILGSMSAYAGSASSPERQAQPASKATAVADVKPHYLFVQTALSATVTAHNLVLHHVRQHTIWFTDRPVRGFGALDTTDFVQNWLHSDATNSFKKDPPNAVLVDSTYHGDKLKHPPLGMALSAPLWNAQGDLVYSVSYLPGSKAPERSVDLKDVSLFVDDVAASVGTGNVAGNNNVNINGSTLVVGSTLLTNNLVNYTYNTKIFAPSVSFTSVNN